MTTLETEARLRAFIAGAGMFDVAAPEGDVMSYIDNRSPYQQAQDAMRCPACGHRPQDDFDRLMESMAGGTFTQRTCPRCNGSGWEPHSDSACSMCAGTGHLNRSEHEHDD